MKLLVVTFIREHQQAVIALVQKAGVKIFSLTETSGIKQKEEQAVSENWFGGAQIAFDSMVLFSFTDEASAKTVIEITKEFNKTEGKDFPVRSFIVSVDQSNLD
jgi:hypothetical protein